MNDRPARIMIVDDEEIVRISLRNWLNEDGYEVTCADSGKAALEKLDEVSPDIMLLDIKMPRMSGIELLEKVKGINSSIQVVMMTAYASVESAVEAMRIGAFDYLVKPFEPEELRILIGRILERKALQKENVALKERLDDELSDDIIGECSQMKAIFQLVEDVADSDSTALITGESGTGKELIAKAIHANSRRRYMPFVPVSLGALPETLIESELFGHEKGAFTGATYARRGRFELAHNGTLFLDEVGDLSAKTQVDLLRVLQESRFTRIGGSREIAVDVRIIAATNRNLKQLIAKGEFRDDLFYRLNVVSIELPPLRERGGDVELLAKRFLHEFAKKTNKPVTEFSKEAIEIINNYNWPGNVRELENAIERAFVVVKDTVIRSNHLPFSIQSHGDDLSQTSLEAMEKHHIRRVLAEHDWNITQTAKALEIDRVTLYNKIKKFSIQKEL